MPLYSILSGCTLFLFTASLLKASLISGPMLAHLEMREAKIWVRTDGPSSVRVVYTPDAPNSEPIWSIPVETDSANANTALITLDRIEPGIRYNYRIELDGKLVTAATGFTSPENYFAYRAAPDFKIAVVGAHYVMEEGFEPPYQTLGGGYDIFKSIQETEPVLMIWAGNTATLRESDWMSKSGYLKRFTQARSVPQMAPLLQSIPHYATWGMSDFGAPYSGWGSATRMIAETGFEAFWPRPTDISQIEGVATQFRYADVDFFMLDVQTYRNDVPGSGLHSRILGNEQIEWLRQALIRSTATFKVVIAGAPILNPADSYGNLSHAKSEHKKFLGMLRDERISGLFFISGGKPFGEFTRSVHSNFYNLHDLTVGPLTARIDERKEELNFFRAPGSSIFERHFVLIEFSGPEEDRQIVLRTMNAAGKELWTWSIRASNLQAPER